ncbi:MAG: hypothetical protein ABEK16_00925 [Candidatus Nanohalobium sp.]
MKKPVFLFLVLILSTGLISGSVEREVELNPGWNTIGVDIEDVSFSEDIRPKCNFGGYNLRLSEGVDEGDVAQENRYFVWSQEGGDWSHPDRLQPMKGYSVYLDQEKSCSFSLEGETSGIEEIELEKGWNLINLNSNEDMEDVWNQCGDKLNWYNMELKGEDDPVIDESSRYYFWINNGYNWENPMKKDYSIDKADAAYVNAESSCTVNLGTSDTSGESSSTEDVQRFKLTRNSDGLYSISGKNGYIVQSPDGAFGFGDDGRKKITLVNKQRSNPTEEYVTLEKPNFDLKVVRNPPIAETGEEVKVKITDFSGGSSTDPYNGIRAGGKEFNSDGDMETSSTDESPGPEKLMVSSSEAGPVNVYATLTDNTPGDGVQTTKKTRVHFSDGFLKDYRDETVSGRAISFTKKQNEITGDWTILHQEKGSKDYQIQDWNSDVYDGSDRTPWIERRLLGGRYRGVLSIKANHKDRDRVVNDIRVERIKDVGKIAKIMFRVFANTQSSDAKLYLTEGDELKSAPLRDGVYRLIYDEGIRGYSLYRSNSLSSKGSKVKSFSNFNVEAYGFEVDTSVKGVKRGQNELYLDWIMTQSLCNNRDYPGKTC